MRRLRMFVILVLAVLFVPSFAWAAAPHHGAKQTRKHQVKKHRDKRGHAGKHHGKKHQGDRHHRRSRHDNDHDGDHADHGDHGDHDHGDDGTTPPDSLTVTLGGVTDPHGFTPDTNVDGSYLVTQGTSLDIWGIATDENGTDVTTESDTWWTLSVDGASGGDVAGSDGGWTTTIDTTGWAEGLHTVTFSATDARGATSQVSVPILISLPATQCLPAMTVAPRPVGAVVVYEGCAQPVNGAGAPFGGTEYDGTNPATRYPAIGSTTPGVGTTLTPSGVAATTLWIGEVDLGTGGALIVASGRGVHWTKVYIQGPIRGSGTLEIAALEQIVVAPSSGLQTPTISAGTINFIQASAGVSGSLAAIVHGRIPAQ